MYCFAGLCWEVPMFFRMLYKGFTGTIYRSHYILLLPIINSKIISTALVTVFYKIFATIYSNSPCNSIGRRVKHLVTQSSFQNNLILNVDLMCHWCIDNILGIIFIKINTDDVQNHITKFPLE